MENRISEFEKTLLSITSFLLMWKIIFHKLGIWKTAFYIFNQFSGEQSSRVYGKCILHNFICPSVEDNYNEKNLQILWNTEFHYNLVELSEALFP